MENFVNGQEDFFSFVTSPINEREGWLFSYPVSKKKYTEPVKEEFFPAKNSNYRSIIVRRWRTRIDEPFRYEVFPGYINIELAGIVVPAKEIRKLLEKEKILSGDDIDLFISAVRAAFKFYKTMIKNDLAKNDNIKESFHSLIAFYTPKKELLEDIISTILYTTDKIFPLHKEKIRDFLERYKEELMTVKVVRKFKIYNL